MRHLYGVETAKARAARALALALFHAAPFVLAASPAGARDGLAETADGAFRAWMRLAGVRDASLAVAEGETVLGAFGYGARRPDEPAPVASLSKAITAACVGTLVDAGRLSYDTPLGEVLRPVFREHGEPKDGRVGAITVGQLVTHRSGLKIDSTQRGGTRRLPVDERANRDTFLAALAGGVGDQPGRVHAYNNANYAGLGLVIETVTGEGYEAYCRRTVLEPLGAGEARIGAGVRVLGAYGGWELSAPAYARFTRALAPDGPLLGLKVRALPEPSPYGLGYRTSRTGRGPVLHHHGSWVGPTNPPQFGAYFARFPNGVAVVATYDRNVSPDLRAVLAADLASAVEERP